MDGHVITSRPITACSAWCSSGGLGNRERPGLMTWLVLSLLSLSVFLPTDVIGTMAEDIVSGVLESVNLESNTVRIRNSLDQPIFLKIKKPHLLENVTPGEHVTVVVNKHHEIIKLIETPIPELPPPTGH